MAERAQEVAALRAERDALRASWSWRITAPLRWVAQPIMRGQAGARLETVASSPARRQAASAVAAPLRPLVAAMERVLRDPHLSARVNRRLMRYPKLHAWLVGLSRRAGIYRGPPAPLQSDWTGAGGGAPATAAPPAPPAAVAATEDHIWPRRGDGTGVHASQRSPLEAAIRHHIGLN
jgi:hypothetical protein